MYWVKNRKQRVNNIIAVLKQFMEKDRHKGKQGRRYWGIAGFGDELTVE